LCLTRSSIPTAHYPPSTQTSTLSLHDALPICEMEISNTIAKSQTSFFAGKHTATLGGQYKYENLTDNGNELQSRADLRRLTRWGYALFAEDEWMLTDNFSLTGGMRYDKDENFGDHWTPRLFGVWQTTDHWTIKGDRKSTR